MERGRRNISPRTRISRSLDNGRPVFLPSVRHDAIPVARTAGIREDIKRLALVACRCITGRFAELTVRAVSVELCASGEGHAFIVLFHNIAAFDISNESAHVLLVVSRFLLFNSILSCRLFCAPA